MKVLNHVGRRRGRVRHVLGGVHDALRNVGRVDDRPLCACLARRQQAQADKDCHSCFHCSLLFGSCLTLT